MDFEVQRDVELLKNFLAFIQIAQIIINLPQHEFGKQRRIRLLDQLADFDRLVKLLFEHQQLCVLDVVEAGRIQ